MSADELGLKIDEVDEQIIKVEEILDLLNQCRKKLHKEWMKARKESNGEE